VSLVLDTSVAVSWIFGDAATTGGNALLDRVAESGAFAPRLLWYEFTNVIAGAAKRGRVSAADAIDAFAFFGRLPVLFDDRGERVLQPLWFALAQRHGLSAYDASYLELALRLSLPLATRDKALAAAARAEGLTVWG